MVGQPTDIEARMSMRFAHPHQDVYAQKIGKRKKKSIVEVVV